MDKRKPYTFELKEWEDIKKEVVGVTVNFDGSFRTAGNLITLAENLKEEGILFRNGDRVTTIRERDVVYPDTRIEYPISQESQLQFYRSMYHHSKGGKRKF
jgi:DNA polymerase III sliding clamp (beta) subunit (PCNA family)